MVKRLMWSGLLAGRGAPASVASLVTDAADLNRDGRVNALDFALARTRLGRTLAPLPPVP